MYKKEYPFDPFVELTLLSSNDPHCLYIWAMDYCQSQLKRRLQKGRKNEKSGKNK